MHTIVELTAPITLWYLLMRTTSISSSYLQNINCTCNRRSSWTRPHCSWQPIMQWILKCTLALNMCVSVCCMGCKVAEANYAMQYAWPGMHEGGGSTNASGLTTLFIRTRNCSKLCVCICCKGEKYLWVVWVYIFAFVEKYLWVFCICNWHLL